MYSGTEIVFFILYSHIGGVIVSVLASRAVDRGFKSRSGQAKRLENCFSANHATLRRKSKEWLIQNQDNVFEWGDMSIHGMFFH